jgi:hypothetical protein
MSKGNTLRVGSLVVVVLLAGLWLVVQPCSLARMLGTGEPADGLAASATPGSTRPTSPLNGRDAGMPDAKRVSPSTPPAANPAPYLAFESAMLQGSELSLDQAMLALKGDAFDHYLALIAQQSMRVPEAAELTDAYSRTLQAALKENPALSMQNFACGLSLCAGTISTGGRADAAQVEQWRQSLSLAGNTPAYSMIDVTVPGKDGRVEHRFIFSSDARINGIHGPSLP